MKLNAHELAFFFYQEHGVVSKVKETQ